LAATGIDGADDLLPVTFLVIVCTVTIYGLAAAPVARLLGLTQPDPVPDDADAVATTDGTVERTPREVDSD